MDATPALGSATVGANVARRRALLGVSSTALAAALKAGGVPMSPSGISDIERGKRTVTVEQLLALSVALGTTPVALLMPETADAGDPVSTAGLERDAQSTWAWLRGESALTWPHPVGEVEEFPGEKLKAAASTRSRFWRVDTTPPWDHERLSLLREQE